MMGLLLLAVMGIEDHLLNNLVKELATRLTLKKSMAITTTPKTFNTKKINSEINSLKIRLKKNIRSLKRVSH